MCVPTGTWRAAAGSGNRLTANRIALTLRILEALAISLIDVQYELFARVHLRHRRLETRRHHIVPGDMWCDPLLHPETGQKLRPQRRHRFEDPLGVGLADHTAGSGLARRVLHLDCQL